MIDLEMRIMVKIEIMTKEKILGILEIEDKVEEDSRITTEVEVKGEVDLIKVQM